MKNLVLIDDDDLFHEHVRRHLRNSDWVVTSFLDADKALSFLRENHSPDVLIVDNRMPRIDGVEFLAMIKSETGIDIPMMFLCSEIPPLPVDTKQLDLLGAEFILKERVLKKAELLAAIEDLPRISTN